MEFRVQGLGIEGFFGRPVRIQNSSVVDEGLGVSFRKVRVQGSGTRVWHV